MDVTFELVSSLDHQEEKQFRRFLSTRNTDRKRKDLQLFDMLRQKKKNPEIIHKLYGTPPDRQQIHAYHQLRQALNQKLREFLLDNSREENGQLKIIDDISLSRALFKRKKYALSWLYLKEAEAKAVESEQFELLNLVYYLQAEHSGTMNHNSFLELIEKREENTVLANKNYNLTIALGLIKYTLNASVFSGDTGQVEELLKPVLSRYHIANEVETVSALKCKVTMIVFWCLRERGEYLLALSYLEKAYHEMLDKRMFDGHNYAQKLEMLTWLAGYSLKCKDIVKTMHYRFLLEQAEAEQGRGSFPNRLGTMISFDFFLATNRPGEAAEVLNNYEIRSNLLDDEDLFYLSCSKALLAFIRKDHQSAIQCIFPLLSGKNEKLWSRFFGSRSVLMLHVAEAILHYEKGNFDFVDSRLECIRRKFEPDIALDLRLQDFLSVFKKLNKKPGIEKSPAFMQDVNRFLLLGKTTIGSFEFIDYNSWLKARLEGRDYYEVYLELIDIPLLSEETEILQIKS